MLTWMLGSHHSLRWKAALAQQCQRRSSRSSRHGKLASQTAPVCADALCGAILPRVFV